MIDDVPPDQIKIEIRDSDTNVERVRIGSKWGVVNGWRGSVVLECNAVAHWLIEAAARGPGLGGRTALGFGRIRVTEC
ncbi:MAG: hypothetical protein NVS3B20_08750 [Polyangiales bacterium]